MKGRALVREPGNRYRGCVSSHPLRHTVDLERARRQHAEYCRLLSDLGLEVIKLPRDDVHPDSCFVEDNAVVHGGRALICRAGVESRRGEETEVEKVLSEFMSVWRATAPATVEGGDVLHLPDRLVSGLTKRTNREGVTQMASWLDVRVDAIDDDRIMHLKSYVSHLGKGRLLATAKYAGNPMFAGNQVLVVPEDEAYAANVLAVDNAVLIPKGYPLTEAVLRDAGYELFSIDMSEFTKCDGAMTCPSILF